MASQGHVRNKSCINVITSVYIAFNVMIFVILPRCSKIHNIQFLPRRTAVKESVILSGTISFLSSLYISCLTTFSSAWLTPHQHIVLYFSEQKQNRSHTGRISPGFTSCGLVGPANSQETLLLNNAGTSDADIQ